MAEHSESHEHDSHDEQHGSMGKYAMVFVALLVLTTASFAVGTAMHGTFFGNTLMMAISCVKALLVMLFFMHLIWEANWKYVLTIPASFMSLFLVFALTPDIGFRTRWYTEERWLHAAEEDLESHDAHDDDSHGDDPHADEPHVDDEQDDNPRHADDEDEVATDEESQ